MPFLEVNLKDPTLLEEKYDLCQIQFENKTEHAEEVYQLFPENGEGKDQRAQKCTNSIREQFVKEQEMGTMVAHIVVAHMWTHQVVVGS